MATQLRKLLEKRHFIRSLYFARTLRTDQHVNKALYQSTGIYALSSGFGKCGVSVIRISGDGTQSALLKLGRKQRLPKERSAVVWNLYHPRTNIQLDKGLVFWFRGPSSFTGEDVCELHVHGGPAVVAAMLDALASLPGLRPAEAGDFTKRAFHNGKLDLTEVEGLGDLIHAETEAQRRQALQQMQGALSTLYGAWRKSLVTCVANAEAYIDFSEDDNIEDGVMDQVETQVHDLQKELARHLADKRRGERLRSGVSVAIVGEPNVGKSSLLNAITQRETAIVSSIAGTTRDVIEKAMDIGGYPVMISDTAGLRESEDVIEKEGVQRALQRAAEADLSILVLNAKDVASAAKDICFDPRQYITQHLRELGLDLSLNGNSSTDSSEEIINRTSENYTENENENKFDMSNLLIVLNKSDLLTDIENIDGFVLTSLKQESQLMSANQNESRSMNEETASNTTNSCGSKNRSARGDELSSDWPICVISCTTGDGLDAFLGSLTEKLEDLCSNSDVGSPSLTQARHRAHLTKCLEHLHNYDDYRATDIVLATEELRQALRQLGKVTGKITSDEILDVVFRDFCIGK